MKPFHEWVMDMSGKGPQEEVYGDVKSDDKTEDLITGGGPYTLNPDAVVKIADLCVTKVNGRTSHLHVSDDSSGIPSNMKEFIEVNFHNIRYQLSNSVGLTFKDGREEYHVWETVSDVILSPTNLKGYFDSIHTFQGLLPISQANLVFLRSCVRQ